MPPAHKSQQGAQKRPAHESPHGVLPAAPVAPRKHPWLLGLAVALMIIWIGFLAAMVWHG